MHIGLKKSLIENIFKLVMSSYFPVVITRIFLNNLTAKKEIYEITFTKMCMQVRPINTLSKLVIHSCPKLKLQPVLPFSSFVYNSSTNEHKNMKLREYICFEIFN